MALDESALSELLVALADRDRGVDLVRELAEWLAQRLIEAEAEAGEDELSPGVKDVAAGEADHRGPPGIRSTTWMRVFAPKGFSL